MKTELKKSKNSIINTFACHDMLSKGEIVEKNGGVVHESCKKDTNFLVMADKNSTSSKAEKARKNGTTMLSEEEFIEMCEVL